MVRFPATVARLGGHRFASEASDLDDGRMQAYYYSYRRGWRVHSMQGNQGFGGSIMHGETNLCVRICKHQRGGTPGAPTIPVHNRTRCLEVDRIPAHRELPTPTAPTLFTLGDFLLESRSVRIWDTVILRSGHLPRALAGLCLLQSRARTLRLDQQDLRPALANHRRRARPTPYDL